MASHLRSKNNQRVNIYIIDDDSDTLGLYEKILSQIFKNNCSIKTFLNRTDFLLSLHTCSHANGLIICDVVLPDGNGFQLKDNLLKKKVDIPLLFITGLGSLKNSKEAGYHVLSKPLSKPILIEGIKQITDFEDL